MRTLRRRRSAMIRISMIRGSPWPASRGTTRCDIANGSAIAVAAVSGCRRRQNGSAPREVEWKGSTIRGAMIRMTHAHSRVRDRWGQARRMATVFSTCARTSTNGATIGMRPTTIASRRIAILRARHRVRGVSHAAARGGIRSRSAVVPRVRAFLRSFATQITDFEWRAPPHRRNRGLTVVMATLADTRDVQDPSGIVRDEDVQSDYVGLRVRDGRVEVFSVDTLMPPPHPPKDQHELRGLAMDVRAKR